MLLLFLFLAGWNEEVEMNFEPRPFLFLQLLFYTCVYYIQEHSFCLPRLTLGRIVCVSPIRRRTTTHQHSHSSRPLSFIHSFYSGNFISLYFARTVCFCFLLFIHDYRIAVVGGKYGGWFEGSLIPSAWLYVCSTCVGMVMRCQEIWNMDRARLRMRLMLCGVLTPLGISPGSNSQGWIINKDGQDIHKSEHGDKINIICELGCAVLHPSSTYIGVLAVVSHIYAIWILPDEDAFI